MKIGGRNWFCFSLEKRRLWCSSIELEIMKRRHANFTQQLIDTIRQCLDPGLEVNANFEDNANLEEILSPPFKKTLKRSLINFV